MAATLRWQLLAPALIGVVTGACVAAASAHIFRSNGTRLAHAKEKPKPPAGIEPATC